jgi:hypothetical protein
VNWEAVCKPKSHGGLGIKKAVHNQAMVAKIGWRISQNDGGLWCKIFTRKYLKNESSEPLLLATALALGAVCALVLLY